MDIKYNSDGTATLNLVDVEDVRAIHQFVQLKDNDFFDIRGAVGEVHFDADGEIRKIVVPKVYKY